jgi:geranylgeranyl diphosphate synthase type II
VKTSVMLKAYLEHKRGLIEDELDRLILPLGTAPPVLHEAMRYTLLAPGKRLRGVLVLAVVEMLRGDQENALGPACAVEMTHAASLILDDLPAMDGATLRRGKPTLHLEVGEANAILAAVALLNFAFETIQRKQGLRDKVRRDLSARLAAAVGAGGLIGGQVVDLASSGVELDLEQLEYIHSHKTGALFIAAVQSGGVIANAGRQELDALGRYAKNLGLAFQITDDLLDYSGDPVVIGKDTGQDRDHTTFVDLCGIDGARRLVDELIEASKDALTDFGKRAHRLVEFSEFVRCRDH